MSRSTHKQNEIVTDRKHLMTFGKYKGESIQDILDVDAQYLVWLHNNSDFELSAELLDEAEGLPSPVKDWYDLNVR